MGLEEGPQTRGRAGVCGDLGCEPCYCPLARSVGGQLLSRRGNGGRGPWQNTGAPGSTFQGAWVNPCLTPCLSFPLVQEDLPVL